MQPYMRTADPQLATRQSRIAVLIPCYNEAQTIGRVAEFRAQLPGTVIYVYDNNSTDRSAELAKASGAVVGR